MPISPTLETKRLILRAPKLSDADAHQKHFNDYEILRYLAPTVPNPYLLEHSMAMLAKTLDATQPNYFWGITAKEFGDNLIGMIEIRPDNPKSNRGFWMGRAFHNRGYMTEAIHATTDFWFDTLGKDVMLNRNARGNDASTKLKDKIGAEFVGLEPQSFLDPAFTEAELWKLTKDAWRKFKTAD